METQSFYNSAAKDVTEVNKVLLIFEEWHPWSIL